MLLACLFKNIVISLLVEALGKSKLFGGHASKMLWLLTVYFILIFYIKVSFKIKLKGTLMQTWKSLYMFMLLWK